MRVGASSATCPGQRARRGAPAIHSTFVLVYLGCQGTPLTLWVCHTVPTSSHTDSRLHKYSRILYLPRITSTSQIVILSLFYINPAVFCTYLVWYWGYDLTVMIYVSGP
jgi:hypothetical protein